jgi:hypothetical protein
MKRRQFIAGLGSAAALAGGGARAATGPNAAACWPTRSIRATTWLPPDEVIE